MTYKSLGNHDPASGFTGAIQAVLRKADGAFIPFDTGNIDYQEYLEWLDDGNRPDLPD